MTKTLFSIIIFAALLAAGQSTARPDRAATSATSVAADSPRIQSPNLRIEFDNNMRSRVVARSKGKELP
jgi:hypothetical protein